MDGKGVDRVAMKRASATPMSKYDNTKIQIMVYPLRKMDGEG